ncbi:MAG: peptidoglycan-binding protein [Tepidanaerobacteraceae bacterium]|jgi:peptidoglycan hydrolase-like protein with peptidoglycan-binding domain|nr:peptidoglycan-binding protein [Tepidanaerobacteraceae bacterium]
MSRMRIKQLFLFIAAIILISHPAYIIGAPRCSCGEDRTLRLQNPPMTGSDVTEIQFQLKKIGYYKGVVNGIYDKKTSEAVIDFQKSEGINPDGIFGAKTLLKMAQIYEKPAARLPSEKPRGEVSIIIFTLERKLVVMSDGKPFKSFPVAVGTFDTPTPIGLFTITQKDIWGEGFGSRWMRLSVPWGIYGIHGTNKPWSIGNFESHGCIRMHNQHVEQVYDWVKIGTKVYIIGGVDGPFTFGLKPLTQGSKGSDVMEVQKRLSNYGYYNGRIDGIYGRGVREAVKAFQQDNGLDPSGSMDDKTYKALGIMLFE